MAGSDDHFIGRRQELDALRSALDATRAGQGRLVLLSGEPGIGKTRTAVELGNHAILEGAQVVWGRCHEEAGAPPYWPWAQVVRGIIQAHDDGALRDDLGAGAADIAEVVPGIRDRLTDLETASPARDPAEARFRLFDSLTRFLIAASRRQPRVIVLDDLHWADVPSLRLLEFLAPEIGDSRLLLIGSYRENELSRQHPLSDTLGGLARVAHTSRVHLSGLDWEEVRHFIALTAGIVPPAWLTRSIHTQTEGNPLFLREVVRFLRQQGQFDAALDGQTRPAVRIPEGVREVIGRRLNLLSAPCNAVLALAAVVGREFTVDILVRAAADRAEDEVSQAIDEALDARILEETAPDRYQFTHALIRMTLYDELRSGQRRRLHRAVGEAIEALHRRDPTPVLPDLARHFHAAALGGDVGRAIDYAIRAGQHADAVLAFEDAITFFQSALDLIEQMDDPDPREHCALLLRLGESQRKTNDFSSAKTTLLTAAALARAHGFHDLLADVAISFEIAEWRHGYEDANAASNLLKEALGGLRETMEARRIKVTGLLARARLYAGAVSEAKAILFDAIAMARAFGDPAVIASNISIMTDFPWEPKETQGLLAFAVEAAAMAERAGDLEILSQVHERRVAYHLELGQIREAHAAIEAIVRVHAQIRQPVFTLMDIGLRTTLALLRGDLAEAERLILQGLRLRAPGRTHVTDPLSVLIFNLRREQGRLAELRPLVLAFAQSDAAAAWRPGLALLHLEFSDLTAARALFDDLAKDEFAAVSRDGRWTASMVYLAEVCAGLGDAAHAAVLHRLLLPWAGRNIILGGGSGCPGSTDRFLGLLAATMARWTDAEAHFSEALAMNERTGALAPLAHTRHDFAAMLLARGFPGDRDRAIGLLHQARDSADTLGLVGVTRKVNARLEALAAITPPAPDDLTARELEVLRLLAIGRGNADIALVLSISLNTVATHVRNIFAKTGCANRTEAATYAIRHGLQVTG